MGYELFVHCVSKDCGHHGRINLVALAGKLGMDHGCSADDLYPHFYCSRCRAAGRPDKALQFQVRPLIDPHSAWPREGQ